MSHEAILKELESYGTEQNRKIYRRHGVKGEMYGVSYANLGVMKKKIKVNQDLAEYLWATGNHDARVLATMITDKDKVNEDLLERWIKDLDGHTITDAFVNVANQYPQARQKMEAWITSDKVYVARVGWHMLAHLALYDPALPDGFFEPYLTKIEQNIHTSPNRIREAMNNTLIAIGARNPQLQEVALAAADRIGKVTVDHGETDCKTPDARTYILKTVARKEKKTG